MLWIALYLPHLAREISPSRSDPRPERAALEALAAWAGRFTPNVSLEDDRGLLLEVEASLRLFGGLHTIVGALRADLAEMGYAAHIACAPTGRAAWWLAQSRTDRFIVDTVRLEGAITGLPVTVLDVEDDTQEMLEAIGARTLGDLLRLPRDGIARRFGQPVLDQLDRGLGRLAEPRRFFTPPARFRTCLELAAEVVDAEALVFAAKRLLVQLGGFLAARAGGISHFTFTLAHREGRVTEISLVLVTPSCDAGHFMLLMRERLARLTLPEPVRAIALAADEIVPLAGDNFALFHDVVSAANHWPKLVEQLRARLGVASVHGLALGAEHRPECASAACALGVTSSAVNFGLRPMWLLAEPQALTESNGVPQHGGPLKLLAGPERIESGWWDEGSVARDYFIAQTGERTLLWVFRERSLVASDSTGWYLHGLFA